MSPLRKWHAFLCLRLNVNKGNVADRSSIIFVYVSTLLCLKSFLYFLYFYHLISIVHPSYSIYKEYRETSERKKEDRREKDGWGEKGENHGGRRKDSKEVGKRRSKELVRRVERIV